MRGGRSKGYRRWVLGLLAVLSVGLAATGYLVVERWNSVARVQDALQRDWEITFETEDRPRWIPGWLDGAIYDFLERRGSKGAKPNREEVLHARYRALFAGEIEFIGIYYFESFDARLGPALAAFPELRALKVYETTQFDELRSDAVEALLVAIRQMPKLEILELGGPWVDDGQVGVLEGHPTITALTLTDGPVTGRSIDVFVSMPRLEQLTAFDTLLSDADIERLQSLMPDLEIDFDGDSYLIVPE